MEKSGFRRVVNRGYSYNYFVVLSLSRIAFAIRFAPTQNTSLEVRSAIIPDAALPTPPIAETSLRPDTGFLPVVTNNSSPANGEQRNSLKMPTTFP